MIARSPLRRTRSTNPLSRNAPPVALHQTMRCGASVSVAQIATASKPSARPIASATRGAAAAKLACCVMMSTTSASTVERDSSRMTIDITPSDHGSTTTPARNDWPLLRMASTRNEPPVRSRGRRTTVDSDLPTISLDE